MRDWIWVAAALLVLAIWRRNDIAEGVLTVYYATTQSSRANEERYAPVIADAERRHGIPAGLLHRLIYQESRFRSDIIEGSTVSSAGATGIAQLVPRWHPSVDPLDAHASISYAASYLAENKRRFGTWSLALAAYNWGPTNVQRHLARYGALTPDGLPAETREYVASITDDVAVT